MDFTERAHLSEWMDDPCSYEDFRDCLRDLAQVNRMTLAYRPTLHWLNSVLQPHAECVHIVDVGCGGGDMLRHIARWAKQRQVAVRLTGIDLNPHAAHAARELDSGSAGIAWVTGDAFSFHPEIPIGIVVSSLFTHHLPDDEIIQFLQWMERVSRVGWFVNDLHRERLPYYGFRALAAVMRWHRFVQHDAPVSIRRAFPDRDWERYLASAGLPLESVAIETFRPARLCVGRVKS